MTHHLPPLSGVEFNNLIFMFTAWGEARRDPGGTASRFGLPAKTVQRLAELTSEQIVTLIYAVGQTSLVRARPDLEKLMDAPPGMMALVSVASASLPMEGDSYVTP